MAAIQIERDARTNGVEYFDPDETLITALKRAIAHQQDLVVSVKEQGELLVLASRGEYFSFFKDAETFFTMPADEVNFSVLSEKDSPRPSADTTGRSLNELLWQVAHFSSNGRLMAGCYRDDVVELNAWPNLSRLPHTPNATRIASLLASHPTSITFAARLLKIEPSELYQFYSAAHCAGLAKAINRKAEEPLLEPHRQQNLLSALWGKITRL